MGIFERLGKRRYAPGPGVTGAPPERGAGRFFFLLTTHFWKLLALNLLLVAFSLPVISAPAALSGANRVLMKLTREGNCFLWSDFWSEFRQSFWKSVPVGLLFALMFAAGFWLIGIANASEGMARIIAGGIAAFAIVLALLWGGYAFVLLSMLEQPVLTLLKNALALLVLDARHTLCALLALLCMNGVVLALLPGGVVLTLLLWPALTQLMLCMNVNVPLQTHIIGPMTAANAAPPAPDGDEAA